MNDMFKDFYEQLKVAYIVQTCFQICFGIHCCTAFQDLNQLYLVTQ